MWNGAGAPASSSARRDRPQAKALWTPELDEELRTLVARGLPVRAVAAAMGRNWRTVEGNMRRLGLSVRAARRALFQREVARRATDRHPVAHALEWLVSRGWRLAWLEGDLVRLTPPGDEPGPAWPVTHAVRIANNLGAGIPYPGSSEEKP